ncbi:TPA: hypothetical protein ACH3X1_000802 [Trebouxia sp. C0004]
MCQNVDACAIAMLVAGHWAEGTLQQAYLEKNPLSVLVAFAIAAGWDQTSLMRRHFCGRALVRLCPQLATALSWQCQSVLFLPDKFLNVAQGNKGNVLLPAMYSKYKQFLGCAWQVLLAWPSCVNQATPLL